MAEHIIELDSNQNNCLLVLLEWTEDDASYGEDLVDVIRTLMGLNGDEEWNPDPMDFGLSAGSYENDDSSAAAEEVKA